VVDLRGQEALRQIIGRLEQRRADVQVIELPKPTEIPSVAEAAPAVGLPDAAAPARGWQAFKGTDTFVIAPALRPDDPLSSPAVDLAETSGPLGLELARFFDGTHTLDQAAHSVGGEPEALERILLYLQQRKWVYRYIQPTEAADVTEAGTNLPTDEETRAQLRAYRAFADPTLYAAICASYAPLVERIARRLGGGPEPLADLIQVGQIGLIHAVNRFDASRGVKFRTYASHLIAGEIRHYVRDQVGLVRRPRWLSKLNRQLEETVETLRARNGRPPTLEEIGRAMNIEPDGVCEIVRARAATAPVSLDHPGERNGARAIRHLRYETFRLPIEDRIVVMEAIEKLTEMQRKVIYALFYLDLTETEAARRLRISQKHVSRVMHRALAQLGRLLGGRTQAQ
jgi:RNA polymerase sigma-B factor